MVGHIRGSSSRRFLFEISCHYGIGAASGLVALFLEYFWEHLLVPANRAPDHITCIVAVSGASLPQFAFYYNSFLGKSRYSSNREIRCNCFYVLNHPTGLYTLDAILVGSL